MQIQAIYDHAEQGGIVPLYNVGTPTISPALKQKVLEYRKSGLEICVFDRIGPPAVMREFIGFGPQDWVVCSMMAGSPMEGFPGLADAVYKYAYDLGKLNVSNPALRMPLINGGGADSPVTGNPGLMGCHSKGVVDASYPLYCIITEGLITKEGLRDAKGKVICLINHEGDTRVGLRTDSLNGIAQAIVFWPGGFGTDTEALIRMTNTSINGKPQGSRCVFVNLPDRDPHWCEDIGYFDLLFRKHTQSYGRGGVTLAALKNLNNQVIVYNPVPGASPDIIKQDVHSLLFSIRKYDAINEFGCTWPLPIRLIDEMIKPLSKGSTVGPPYPWIEANGTWLNSIRREVKASFAPELTFYRPNGDPYGVKSIKIKPIL